MKPFLYALGMAIIFVFIVGLLLNRAHSPKVQLPGCKPTNMFIIESNPAGKRRVYICEGMNHD